MGSEGHVPPEAVESEASLLGACLIQPRVFDDVAGLLDASDFYKPAHQFVFAAIADLWTRGQPIDAVTVADELKSAHALDDVGGEGFLMDLQATTPAISHAQRYALNIVRTSRLRRLIEVAGGVSMASYEKGADPDAVFDQLCALANDRRLSPREVKLPEGYMPADVLRDLAPEQVDGGEWIIPGSLRKMWRAIFVSGEGGSKSTILRQIAACVANGYHPFVGPGRAIKPRRVLNIDCENPIDVIQHQFDLIDRVSGEVLSRSENLWLWHEEGGINLRERTAQMRFEQILQDCRPELVTMGPIYKLYSQRNSGDSSGEMAALEFLEALDGFRKRFGFAVLMEHHAPKAQGGETRRLDPIGTSAWMRWPEFGIRLRGEDRDEHGHPHTIKLGRFRGDRAIGVWPLVLSRDSKSSNVPWVGEYADGSWKDGIPNAEPEPPPPPEEEPDF